MGCCVSDAKHAASAYEATADIYDLKQAAALESELTATGDAVSDGQSSVSASGERYPPPDRPLDPDMAKVRPLYASKIEGNKSNTMLLPNGTHRSPLDNAHGAAGGTSSVSHGDLHLQQGQQNASSSSTTGTDSRRHSSSSSSSSCAGGLQRSRVKQDQQPPPPAASDADRKKRSTVLEQKLREQYSQIRDTPFWRPKVLQQKDENGEKNKKVIGLTLSKRQLNKFYKWQPVGGNRALEAQTTSTAAPGSSGPDDGQPSGDSTTADSGAGASSTDRSKKFSILKVGSKSRPIKEEHKTDQYGFLLKRALSSRRVKQGAVGDCSFLAILNCLVDFDASFNHNYELSPNNRGGSRNAFLRSLFVAFIPEKNVILVKLYIDCEYRLVPVTPTVPISREGKILCAHSTTATEVWICLLEKAYVTISGGNYDFFGKGSNPNTDGYHLTGWVPETLPINFLMQQISVGQYDAEASKIWDAIHNGMMTGRCVVCLGTGRIKDAVVERGSDDPEGVSVKYGIVQNHAYSVLKAHVLPNSPYHGTQTPTRLLYLKNPWGRCQWKGRFGPRDPVWETLNEEFKNAHLPPGNNGTGKTDDGYFWMEWKDVLQSGTFSHIYILWNKDRLIRKKKISRLSYEVRYDDAFNCLGGNPQFLLNAKKGKKYYFVVSRVKNTTLSSSYIAAHAYRLRAPRLQKLPRIRSSRGRIGSSIETNSSNSDLKKRRTDEEGEHCFTAASSPNSDSLAGAPEKIVEESCSETASCVSLMEGVHHHGDEEVDNCLCPGSAYFDSSDQNEEPGFVSDQGVGSSEQYAEGEHCTDDHYSTDPPGLDGYFSHQAFAQPRHQGNTEAAGPPPEITVPSTEGGIVAASSASPDAPGWTLGSGMQVGTVAEEQAGENVNPPAFHNYGSDLPPEGGASEGCNPSAISRIPTARTNGTTTTTPTANDGTTTSSMLVNNNKVRSAEAKTQLPLPHLRHVDGSHHRSPGGSYFDQQNGEPSAYSKTGPFGTDRGGGSAWASWEDRLWCPSHEQVTYFPGVYTNGECCLMKIQHSSAPTDGSDEWEQYVLLLSQHDSAERVKFSVEIFVEDDEDGGDVDFEMIPDIPRAWYQHFAKEQWPLDCGCMNDKVRYLSNPSFLLMADGETPTDLMMVLLSLQNSLNIRFWEETSQTSFFFRELIDYHSREARRKERKKLSPNFLEALSEQCVGNSGPYRHNCCTHLIKNMKPGTRYLCIVSTFKPLQSGDQLDYDLEITSTANANISMKQLSGFTKRKSIFPLR
ncbi:unnamed protein product [Amoebophrya sp. A120]|nr:unnamed protein product [Amoebophrya sp. A120]|eukprot:GSA120T00002584001.1